MPETTRLIPFGNLALAGVFLTLAIRRRRQFGRRPYLHLFIYWHLAALGLHQFEEYGWPGTFTEEFIRLGGLTGDPTAPTPRQLEILNLFVIFPAFAAAGLLGQRFPVVGLAAIFVNFSNGFFHVYQAVVAGHYWPGAVTGGLLYLPLGLFTVHTVSRRRDLGYGHLLGAFAVGTALSFAPILHILHWR